MGKLHLCPLGVHMLAINRQGWPSTSSRLQSRQTTIQLSVTRSLIVHHLTILHYLHSPCVFFALVCRLENTHTELRSLGKTGACHAYSTSSFPHPTQWRAPTFATMLTNNTSHHWMMLIIVGRVQINHRILPSPQWTSPHHSVLGFATRPVRFK